MSNRINGKKWRDLREEVFRHYGRACSYCGYEDSVMTIDHILPRSKGGDNSWKIYFQPVENVIIRVGTV
jgi:5-methylcytosine-specific restriction endonuclease McrA